MNNEKKCPCACHENKLNRPYSHDLHCCQSMNGFVDPLPDEKKDEGTHTAHNGYCCACEYDIVKLDSLIGQAHADGFLEGKAQEREVWRGKFG